MTMERKLLLPMDIRCPKDTPKIKWLAQQTPAIIELSKDLYRQIRPVCTDRTCRKMTAGKYEYQWKHHVRSKKPRSYPAQYYLKMMFQWINQQKNIFDMEQMRYEKMVKHLGNEDSDDASLHPLFNKEVIRILIVDYLHDPFYYLTGIWAKAFSLFAHVFCQHFDNEDLSSEIKQYVELAFERFMRFVKGHRILSTRRLAPLDKRIQKLDLRALQPITPSLAPRESKSVLYEKSKSVNNYRPSFVASSPSAADSQSLILPGIAEGAEETKELMTPTEGEREEKEGKRGEEGYQDPEAVSGGENEPEDDDDPDRYRRRPSTSKHEEGETGTPN